MPKITPDNASVGQFSSSNSESYSAILAAGDWAVFKTLHTSDNQIYARPVNTADINGDAPSITFGTVTVYGSNSPADLTREPTASGASWVQVKDTAGAGVALTATGGSVIVDTYSIIAVRRVGGTGSVQAILKSNISK